MCNLNFIIHINENYRFCMRSNLSVRDVLGACLHPHEWSLASRWKAFVWAIIVSCLWESCLQICITVPCYLKVKSNTRKTLCQTFTVIITVSFVCFIGVANLKLKFSVKPVLGRWKIQSQMSVSIVMQGLLFRSVVSGLVLSKMLCVR